MQVGSAVHLWPCQRLLLKYVGTQQAIIPQGVTTLLSLSYTKAAAIRYLVQAHVSLNQACMLQGYAPLRQDYEDFYTRRMYYKLHVSMFEAALGVSLRCSSSSVTSMHMDPVHCGVGHIMHKHVARLGSWQYVEA